MTVTKRKKSLDVKLSQFLSDERLAELNEWIAKYPASERQSAVMHALTLVQEQAGFIKSEAIMAVAEYLEMPEIAVYEVATFYTMYDLEKVGKHRINVCINISCMLRGSAQVFAALEKKLKIKEGETTRDGLFTLRHTECLGACSFAPVVHIGKEYHENISPDNIDEMLSKYKQ